MIKNNFEKESIEWCNRQRGKAFTEVGRELYERIRMLEDLIYEMTPTQEQMDKYPALADAYRHYQIIKKLAINNEKS